MRASKANSRSDYSFKPARDEEDEQQRLEEQFIEEHFIDKSKKSSDSLRGSSGAVDRQQRKDGKEPRRETRDEPGRIRDAHADRPGPSRITNRSDTKRVDPSNRVDRRRAAERSESRRVVDRDDRRKAVDRGDSEEEGDDGHDPRGENRDDEEMDSDSDTEIIPVDMSKYSPKTQTVIHTLSLQFSHFYYNLLYANAKKLKSVGTVDSITTGYRDLCSKIISQIDHRVNREYQDKQHLKNFMISLTSMFQQELHSVTLTEMECITIICKEFVLPDFFEVMTGQDIRAYFRELLTEFFRNATRLACGPFFKKIMDYHSQTNLRKFNNEMIKALLMQRDIYLQKFNKQGNTAKVDRDIADKLQSDLLLARNQVSILERKLAERSDESERVRELENANRDLDAELNARVEQLQKTIGMAKHYRGLAEQMESRAASMQRQLDDQSAEMSELRRIAARVTQTPNAPLSQTQVQSAGLFNSIQGFKAPSVVSSSGGVLDFDTIDASDSRRETEQTDQTDQTDYVQVTETANGADAATIRGNSRREIEDEPDKIRSKSQESSDSLRGSSTVIEEPKQAAPKKRRSKVTPAVVEETTTVDGESEVVFDMSGF